MKIKSPLKLIASLLIPQAAGGLGALFTTSAIPQWYAALEKPALNPPSWIFGPVWTVLYLMMGVALFLVWKKLPAKGAKATAIRIAMLVFFAQIMLNALWSILFFGLRSPGAALVEIGVLWAAILWNIIAFWRISKPAGALLIPYLLWVSFAATLNWGIWMLN